MNVIVLWRNDMKSFKEFSNEYGGRKVAVNELKIFKNPSAVMSKLGKIYSNLITSNDTDERIKLSAEIGKLTISYIRTLESRLIALELKVDEANND